MATKQSMNDDDRERTDAELKEFKPARDVLPADLYAGLTKRKPGQRGPGKKPAKVLVALRIDRELAGAYEATGPHWRKTMAEALVQYIGKARKVRFATHKLAATGSSGRVKSAGSGSAKRKVGG